MPRESKAAVMHRPGPLGESPSVHLDALRGFAAFSVLLNHLRDALFVDYEAIARHNPLTSAAYLASGLGHQAVIVFLCSAVTWLAAAFCVLYEPGVGPGGLTCWRGSAGSTLCFCLHCC